MRHFVAVFAILLIVGCGGSDQKEVEPVSGSVVLDGQIPVDATVVFHPINRDEDDRTPVPRGTVKSDGTFEMRTYGANDGAPIGDYKVTFSWQGDLSQYKDLSEDEIDALPELMPEKYTSSKTTDVKVTIKEGKNKLDKFVLNYE